MTKFYTLMSNKMLLFTSLLVLGYTQSVLCNATLTLVPIANCGDQVELTCTSTECLLAYTFTKDGSTIYNQKGPANSSYADRYFGRPLSHTETRLNISNFQYSDVGKYSCYCRFDAAAPKQTLQYQCKARTAVSAITSDKKLAITVDMLYPGPSNIRTVLVNPSSQLPGVHNCGSSPRFAFHYSCTWVSEESLPDGNHSYTITVTTGTQAVLVSGHFRIVTPLSPAISNLVNISNRQVLHGKQNTLLTIKCVSNGGIPAPTLAWYKGNTSTSPLAESTTSNFVHMSDGTYTVTLIHNFTPSRRDDMTPFLCQVFYPGATNEASTDPSPASAILYLDLQPNTTTVSQMGEAASGGSMTLRCSSTNGRPAPSITWFYRGQTFTPTNTSSYDQTSETYTVVSVLHIPVSAVDNGQLATCSVSHTTLSVPRIELVIVDIKFGPSKGSTIIFGNHATPAKGSNSIQLNCTSGSSNPASSITWYNGSSVIRKTGSDTNRFGDNNGVITSNILTITTTRYMDGDNITCRSDNEYGSDSTSVDLDIPYSALILPLPNSTAIEGEPNISITCSASSKPPATFTWYKGSTVLTNGTGTPTNNSFSYIIPRVKRTDAGSYMCIAENNIEGPDSMNTFLEVKYPPNVTVSTSTSQPYIVTCKAEGYPDNYTYQDWVQIWPGYGAVATFPFTGSTLTLTDVNYEKSGLYVCSASNGVVAYGSDVEYMQGKAAMFIEAPPVLMDPSPDGTIVPVAGKLGQNATMVIKYWSNVNGCAVRCYKRAGGSHRSTLSSCSVTQTDTEVILPVYNYMLKETGTLATIKIHVISEEDFTNYDIRISNNVNEESKLEIIITPQGPPEAPTLLGNFSITPGQVILTVLPGFHGGYNQTLVVQISKDLTAWINKTTVYIGVDNEQKHFHLADLKETTIYYIRVFAYNVDGRSVRFSTVLNFTTAEALAALAPTSLSAALIGGTVGASCALLVVTVIVLILWRNRKACWMSPTTEEKRSPAKDKESTECVVECAMYNSVGNVQPGTSGIGIYSTPQKKRKPEPLTNVYNVGTKTETGLYATPMKRKGVRKTGKADKPSKDLPDNSIIAERAFDVMENIPSSPTLWPNNNVNGDGLIYADLEVDNTAKHEVIHGLDDVTVYVDIDFTKTAAPLPESGDEFMERK